MLEILTALAVAAVLAGLAVPAWQDLLRKQRRVDAMQGLLRIQAAQMRHFEAHGRYARRLSQLGWPADRVPSPAGHYLLYLHQDGTPDPSLGYLALAVPRPGSGQEGDACRRLALDERGPNPALSSRPDCWRR